MSTLEKRIRRLLQRPKDYTYDELRALLHSLGYEEYNKGRTSGSRVLFAKKNHSQSLMLHIPHTPPYLKKYAIDNVIDFLKESEDIQ